MPQSRPRTKRLVILLATLVSILAITILAVIPMAAAARLTYDQGTKIMPDAASVLSSSKSDLDLLLGRADWILHACCDHSVTVEDSDVMLEAELEAEMSDLVRFGTSELYYDIRENIGCHLTK